MAPGAHERGRALPLKDIQREVPSGTRVATGHRHQHLKMAPVTAAWPGTSAKTPPSRHHGQCRERHWGPPASTRPGAWAGGPSSQAGGGRSDIAAQAHAGWNRPMGPGRRHQRSGLADRRGSPTTRPSQLPRYPSTQGVKPHSATPLGLHMGADRVTQHPGPTHGHGPAAAPLRAAKERAGPALTTAWGTSSCPIVGLSAGQLPASIKSATQPADSWKPTSIKAQGWLNSNSATVPSHR